MSDQTINRKLSLAIGHPKHETRVLRESGTVGVLFDGWFRAFHFMDWRVIGPIAQRYDCFPFNSGGEWCAYTESASRPQYSDTPQKAIALAVIAAHEAGVLK